MSKIFCERPLQSTRIKEAFVGMFVGGIRGESVLDDPSKVAADSWKFMAPSNRLSAVEVRSIARKGMYHDGGGLYLQVSASGAKSWILRFMLAGRARAMGLGPLQAIPLAEHVSGLPNAVGCALTKSTR